MNLEFNQLSACYEVRNIKEENLTEVLKLCQGNPAYYEKMHSSVTMDSIKHDFTALPPNKEYEDKHFLGYYKQEKLIAVMDLIEAYPNESTAWIGWFMMDKKYQGKGKGTKIITELMEYLKKTGYLSVELGYIKGNLQSEKFWIKNKFTAAGRKAKTADYTIIVMKRELT